MKGMIATLRLPGTVAYLDGVRLMEDLVRRRIADGTRPNILLLLEHAPVYTAGRRLKGAQLEAEQRAVYAKTGIALVATGRGGQTTYHGPGQLVGYPVADLRTLAPAPGERLGVRGFVAALEAAVMAACLTLGVATTRTGDTGVWAAADASRKVAALGVQVSRYVASHGFALNCDVDLRAFDHIVPCGLADKHATSLTNERLLSNRIISPVTVDDAVPAVITAFADCFNADMPLLHDVNPVVESEIFAFLAKTKGGAN
ncbi:hypothetical protein HK100_010976 [Physocladia obscura]|uniref:lipoyl(octanoyl) transferase n=1 Tax=Physocladia obscura TaxID=109957 RepID=A0AAD5T9K2_9FUNG|nr:hypothetical protein HK100_010976 [Physocladia obscura]